MKKIVFTVTAVATVALMCVFTACTSLSDDYTNPGDKLGGGQVVSESASSYDTTSITERGLSATSEIIYSFSI